MSFQFRSFTIAFLTRFSTPFAVAGLCFAIVPSANAQVTLNNITTYEVTSGGNYDGTQFWDTLTGNSAYDVFVIRGSGVNETIINGGATRSLTELFSTNGTFTYTLLTEPGAYNPNGGLSLFFNGSTSAQISAYSPFNTTATPPPAASGAIYNPFGGSTTGANSLSYSSGGTTVALTSLQFFSSGVDRVSSTSTGASNATDLGVRFTLSVSGITAAPEPGALALASIGLVPVGILVRRRR